MNSKLIAVIKICFFTISIYLLYTLLNEKIFRKSYSETVKENILKYKSQAFFSDDSFIIPFVRFNSKYVGSPRYRIASCNNEKVMSTVMMRVMCYLYDKEGWMKNNGSMEMEWSEKSHKGARLCRFRNEWGNTYNRSLSLSRDHRTIFLARDPLQRFLSSFMDKCVHENTECMGCKTDILCLVEKSYKEMMQISREHWDIRDRLDNTINSSYFTNHASPQSWRCDLWDEFESYVFIKYGEDPISQNNTAEKIMDVLEEHKVDNSDICFLRNGIKASTTHATKHSADRSRYERILKESKKHMDLFLKMFYYDYQIFDFPLPVQSVNT